MHIQAFELEGISDAKQLHKYGLVVIKPFPEWDPKGLEDLLHNSPEFKDGKVRAIGGFGAFNFPSSFHHKWPRKLRKEAMKAVYPFLQNYVHETKMQDKFKVHIVSDRVLVRGPDTYFGGEKAHRDEAINALPGDVVLGGWWNTSFQPQYFSCHPGSHTAANNGRGFYKVSKEEQKSFKEARRLVTIPAGCILIFNENLLHEVLGKKSEHVVQRLFLGWRLTTSNTPLQANIQECLRTFKIPLLKSGQTPPAFPKLWRVNWPNKLKNMCQHINPLLLSDTVVKTGKRKGETYTRWSFENATEVLGLTFVAYHQQELDLYTPASSHIIDGRRYYLYRSDDPDATEDEDSDVTEDEEDAAEDDDSDVTEDEEGPPRKKPCYRFNDDVVTCYEE